GEHIHARRVKRLLDVLASTSDNPFHIPQIRIGGLMMVENYKGARAPPGLRKNLRIVRETGKQQIFATDFNVGDRLAVGRAYGYYIRPFAVDDPSCSEPIRTREVMYANVGLPHRDRLHIRSPQIASNILIICSHSTQSRSALTAQAAAAS